MEFFFILFLILLNGFFSMAEIAVVSSRKSKLKQMAIDGSKKSQIALNLAERPGVFLSTIQVGITFIAIVIGAISEDSLVKEFSSALDRLPFFNLVNEHVAFVLIISVITYLSVILGELVPKRVAMSNPEFFASFVAPIMTNISRVMSPLVKILSGSTDFIFGIFRIGKGSAPTVTEDEIKVLIREGTDIGIFNKTEKKLVDRALQLDDLQINVLMVPRNKIVFFNIKAFVRDPKTHLENYHHSRLLFTKGDLDSVLGVIHSNEVMRDYLHSSLQNLDKKLIPPLFVPENTKALKALEMFRHSSMHLALVIDEYGHIQGLITLKNVLEALVGNIKSQEETEPNVVKRDDGSTFVDGTISIREFKKTFSLPDLPKENGDYQTIGGFVMSHLERVPKTGDKFNLGNLIIEVVDMDENRVDKILVRKRITQR